MPFVKGQSGNPGGRPKSIDGVALRDLARKHTQEVIETLASILADESAPHAARVSAANVLLDRGWGKPTQLLGSDPDNPLPIGFDISLVRSSEN